MIISSKDLLYIRINNEVEKGYVPIDKPIKEAYDLIKANQTGNSSVSIELLEPYSNTTTNVRINNITSCMIYNK